MTVSGKDSAYAADRDERVKRLRMQKMGRRGAALGHQHRTNVAPVKDVNPRRAARRKLKANRRVCFGE